VFCPTCQMRVSESTYKIRYVRLSSHKRRGSSRFVRSEKGQKATFTGFHSFQDTELSMVLGAPDATDQPAIAEDE